MSDLRTRIIKLLTDAELASQRFLDTDGHHSTRIRSNEQAATIAADAVIRELDLDTVVALAQDWYNNYDVTPANDPRNPSDVDIAYDDAGYQILVALGLEKPVFP